MTIIPLDSRQSLIAALPYGDAQGYAFMSLERAVELYRLRTGHAPKTAYVCGNLLFLSAKEES